MIPTCPNPIVCSTDNGLSSIREFNIPFVECNFWKEVDDFITWILKSNEAKKFDSFILDDLTEAAEQILKEEKPKTKNIKQAYGTLNDCIQGLIRDLRTIKDKSVVLICKQERFINEMNGAISYGPLIPGKAVNQQLCNLLGEIYHTETFFEQATGVTHEVLRTKANDQYEAGSRSGKLFELEPANLGYIFQKVMS